MTRQCECGCGQPLPAKATRARRFVDNTHRMRARKAKAAVEAQGGEYLVAVEAYLTEQPLPEWSDLPDQTGAFAWVVRPLGADG